MAMPGQEISIGNEWGNRAKKLVRFTIADLFFQHHILPLLMLELIFTLSTFYFSALLSPYKNIGNYFPQILTCAATFSACFITLQYGQGLYDRLHRFRLLAVIRSAALSGIISLTLSLAFVYFVYYEQIGRLTVIYGTLGSTAFFICFRYILSLLAKYQPLKFSVIGQSESMDEVISLSRKAQGDINLQHIALTELMSSQFGPDEILNFLLINRVSDLVITQDLLNDPQTVKFAVAAIQGRIRILDELEFYQEVTHRFPVRNVPKGIVLKYGFSRRNIIESVLKRMIDALLSGIFILLCLPLLVIIAFLIKATSPGPVFIVQPRQGRYLKPFSMYKFRTMYAFHTVANAEKFTEQNDPRVTPIGRLLRPLHLDELPQLWNVLIGEMSLVGPRPETMAFAEKMQQQIPLYELRYLVRPGITGHAQINQGYARADVEETKVKLSYDLFYICHHTLLFDLSILLKTIFFLTHKSR